MTKGELKPGQLVLWHGDLTLVLSKEGSSWTVMTWELRSSRKIENQWRITHLREDSHYFVFLNRELLLDKEGWRTLNYKRAES